MSNDKYSSADQVLRMVLAHFDKDGYRLCSEEFLCLVIQEARGALAALPESGPSSFTDEDRRLAEVTIGLLTRNWPNRANMSHHQGDLIVRALKAITAAPVSASGSLSVPEGMKCVPTKPTDAVVEAMRRCIVEDGETCNTSGYEAMYQAAIKAAPTLPYAVSTRQPTEQAVIDTAMAWFRKMQQQGMTHEDYEGESLDAWAACEAHDLALSAKQERK